MKIAPDLLPILSTLAFPQPTHACIIEQLDRATYTKVNKVLEALGGTWNRKAKAHVFDGDADARIAYAITVGEVETKQDVGHFPTPALIARSLVELAEVAANMHVLEPSAGDGAIVDAIAREGAFAYAVERDPKRRRALVGRCSVSIDCDDFMTFPNCALDRGQLYDRVVMNPPFCKIGLGDHLDHVRRAFELLKPSGVLVAVLPSGITFRRDKRHTDFRAFVEAHGTIVPLPSGSFKVSGTNVETVVVRLVVS